MNSVLKQKVLEAVLKIPAGKVTYFGYIANEIGSDARTVGWILSGLTDEEMKNVPWYRVVSKSGYISSLKLGFKGIKQRDILIQEGYALNGDVVDMSQHCTINI